MSSPVSGQDDPAERWQSVDRWVGTISYEFVGGPNIPIGGIAGTSRQTITYDVVLEREDDRTWRGGARGQASVENHAEQPTEHGFIRIAASGQGALSDEAYLRMNYRRGSYSLGITGRPGPIEIEYSELWVAHGTTVIDISQTIRSTLARVSTGAPFQDTPVLPAGGDVLSGTLEFSFPWESHRLTWSLQPSGTVSVEIRGPVETIEGLDSEPFTAVVSPSGVDVESYVWEANWPEGAGHRPEVNFEDPDAESTRVLQASWFALPDSRWLEDTGAEAVYEIVVTARIGGVDYRSDPYPWTVTVEGDGEIMPHPVWGEEWTIEIEQSEEDGLWYVTGPGNFRRYSVWPFVRTPDSSDFYDKVLAHEEHHVRQHHHIEPWASMWDVERLYRTVLVNLPGQPTRRDMFWLAMDAVDAWEAHEIQDFLENQCQMEWDAFQIEYGVEPRYLEWRRKDVEETYGCTF